MTWSTLSPGNLVSEPAGIEPCPAKVGHQAEPVVSTNFGRRSPARFSRRRSALVQRGQTSAEVPAWRRRGASDEESDQAARR